MEHQVAVSGAVAAAQPASRLQQQEGKLKELEEEAAQWKSEAERAADPELKKAYLSAMNGVNARIVVLQQALLKEEAGELLPNLPSS
jgi:hypothetical protein